MKPENEREYRAEACGVEDDPRKIQNFHSQSPEEGTYHLGSSSLNNFPCCHRNEVDTGF